MEILKTPICIVGAGPAGITASIFLSKYKINHILVDEGCLPKDKVCGETFIGRIEHVLKDIEPQLQQQLLSQHTIATSTEICGYWYPNEKKINLNFSSYKYPFIKSKRSVFDYTLLQKALESSYLTYHDNCHIHHYLKTDKSVELTDKSSSIKIEAEIAILCVGEQIKKLHHLFPDYATDGFEFLASRIYFSNPQYQDNSYKSEVHFFKYPMPHMLYTTRLPNNTAMIEIFMLKSEAKKINFQLEEYLKKSIQQSATLRNRFCNATVTGKTQGKSFTLGTNPRKLSDERFLLAGSSMGSIHIFSGLGVGHAMRSGQLAAYWAHQSIIADNFSTSFLKQYDKAIKERFKVDYIYGKIFLLSVKYAKLVFYFSRPIFYLLQKTVGCNK